MISLITIKTKYQYQILNYSLKIDNEKYKISTDVKKYCHSDSDFDFDFYDFISINNIG